MKIIDLLNIWVKDKNKLPKKIKIDNEVFGYEELCNLYKTPDKDCFLIQDYLTCMELLYQEVEIIEENKEIEELHILDEGESNEAFYKYCSKLLLKQNEVIRAVNKIIKQREENNDK